MPVVAMTGCTVVGLVAGMAILRRARVRREVRGRDPWWQWQTQWQRVEIGRRRLVAIYEGREGDSADAVYDVYSFFLNCQHLRARLAADKVSGMSWKKATKVIKRSTYLRVCADLANRTKHIETDASLDRQRYIVNAAGCERPLGDGSGASLGDRSR
jgi:hypothetical protein